MIANKMPNDPSDPFRILGLPAGAGEQEVRSRYLSLVKEFPPEQDPEKFQIIHAAYRAASDPLVMAERLLRFDSFVAVEPRQWSDIIAEQKANPPRLSVALLLSLGNTDDTNTAT